jgi:hypothetical protein
MPYILGLGRMIAFVGFSFYFKVEGGGMGIDRGPEAGVLDINTSLLVGTVKGPCYA